MLGLLYRPPAFGEPIVGLQVAVDQFVAALDRYATTPCTIYAAPRAVAAIQQRLALRHIAVADARTLTTVDAWHELALDVKRSLAVRRHARGTFPITLTHHTLSYRELAHDRFLRLLLEGPAPYDSILCSSTASRDAVQKLLSHVADAMNRNHGTRLRYRGRLDVIPIGVDTDRFRPRDRRDARARAGLPPDVFLLLWIGRLSSIDKADLLPLVRVVADLVRAYPEKNLRLMCVGGERPGEAFGRAINEYAQQLGIAANVLVANEVPPAGAHLVHACADVFVSPVDNVQETFGLTPVEAMACGVPQVVSDWNGYRDTVVDGETGFRIPTLWSRCDEDVRAMAAFHDPADDHLALAQSVVVDPDALRDRLAELIANDALRHAMGERSRARAERLYSICRIVAAHEALWSELSAQATRSPFTPPPAAIDDVPYYDVFEHYATRGLSTDDVIEVTERGSAVIEGRERPRSTLHWPGIHDVDRYKRILATVRSAPVRMNELGVDGATVRAVSWLLKYGFVRVRR